MRIREGDLTAVVDDNGAFLREIAIGDEEFFRGIGLIARDANWGTPALEATAIPSEATSVSHVRSAGDLESASRDSIRDGSPFTNNQYERLQQN